MTRGVGRTSGNLRLGVHPAAAFVQEDSQSVKAGERFGIAAAIMTA